MKEEEAKEMGIGLNRMDSLGGLGAADQHEEVKLQRVRSRRQSKDRLVDLLRQNTRRQSVRDGQQTREYQMITAGEDGMIFWWNFEAPYITDLSAITPADPRRPNDMLTVVKSNEIETIRSIH